MIRKKRAGRIIRKRGRRLSDYRVDTLARCIYWFVNSSIVLNVYTTPGAVGKSAVDSSLFGIGLIAFLAVCDAVIFLDISINDFASAAWEFPFAFRTRPWVYYVTAVCEAGIVYIPLRDGLQVTIGQVYFYAGMSIIGVVLALHSSFIRLESAQLDRRPAECGP